MKITNRIRVLVFLEGVVPDELCVIRALSRAISPVVCSLTPLALLCTYPRKSSEIESICKGLGFALASAEKSTSGAVSAFFDFSVPVSSPYPDILVIMLNARDPNVGLIPAKMHSRVRFIGHADPGVHLDLPVINYAESSLLSSPVRLTNKKHPCTPYVLGSFCKEHATATLAFDKFVKAWAVSMEIHSASKMLEEEEEKEKEKEKEKEYSPLDSISCVSSSNPQRVHIPFRFRAIESFIEL